MVYVEFEYSYRSRKILIEGDITNQALKCINLLIQIKKRIIFQNLFQNISSRLNYQNQEICQIVVFSIVIIISQLIANFLCPLAALDYSTHFLTIAATFYILIFHIFMPKSCKLYMQIFPIIGFSTVMIVLYTKDIVFSSIFTVLLVLSIIVLIIGILKFFMQNQLQNKIVSIFQLQSNLIYWFYLSMKVPQFIMPYLNSQNISSQCFIPSLAVLFIVSSIKIWRLFDFNKAFILNLLALSHKHQSKAIQNKEYIKQIFLHNQTENINTQKKHSKKKKKLSQQKQASSDKQSYKQNQILDQVQQNGNSIQNYKFADPFNDLIILIFVLNTIIFVLAVIFSIVAANQKVMFCLLFCNLKLNFLILLSQYIFVAIGHQQKSTIVYMFYIIMDLIFISFPASFIMLNVYQSQSVLLWFQNSFSIFINCICPFITVKLFWQVTKKCSQQKNNTQVLYFFIFWVYFISFRQLPRTLLNQQTVTFIMDVISLSFAGIYVFIISNYNPLNQLLVQLKKIIIMKKFKFYLFQSLKKINFNFKALNQTFFYINACFMLGVCVFTQSYKSLSEYQIRCYQIVYFCSHFIYLVFCRFQFKTQKLIIKNNISSYYFDIISMLLLLVVTVYILFAFLNSYDYFHNQTAYSLLVSSLVIFVVFASQVSYFAIVNFLNYVKFVKLLSLSLSYICIFYPFFSGFTIGYYISVFDINFIFSYGVIGFFYIAFIFTIIGVLIHNILNLTQKSKKNLYIVQFMTEELRKINMLEDPQTLLIISNLYDIMDGDANKLLKYLQTQQVTKIIIHDQKSVSYDYQFGNPQQNYLVEDNLIQILQGSKTSKQIYKPLLKLKTRKQKNQIKKDRLKTQKKQIFLIDLEDSQQLKESFTNQNIVQIKRMITKLEKVVTQSQSLRQLRYKSINPTEQSTIINQYNVCIDYMHRFFLYLSHPCQKISKQTFLLLLQLLQINSKDVKLGERAFFKFSNGQYMDENYFKQFIIDFTSNSFQLQQPNNIESIIRKFVLNQLLFLIYVSNQYFTYFLKRKKVQLTQKSIKLWSQFGNQHQFKQLQKYKMKQVQKINKNLSKKNNKKKKQFQVQVQQNKILNQVLKVHLDSEISLWAKKDTIKEEQNKKHITFMSPDMIYALVVNRLIQCMTNYQKIQIQGFHISSIRLTMSNFIAISTKLSDFISLYLYPSMVVLYSYYMSNFQNNRYILSIVNYEIIVSIAFFGVFLYILLLFYHRNDFQTGTLGLDQNQRTLSLSHLKYYTTFMLFLMGSSFANYFLMAFLNSFICDYSINKLFNFPNFDCNDQKYFIFICLSLLSLIIYYPLALITFPYSSAIDRNLQIKYKSQYDILYLQCKFLVIGVDIVFSSLSFKNQQLIKSCSKTLICIILFLFFHKLKPCSFQWINGVQGKIYVILIIVNLASILCYFLGFTISVILVSVSLGLFVIYLIISSVWNLQQIFPKNNHQSDQIMQQIVANQKNFKLKLKKSVEQQASLQLKQQQIKQQNSQMSIMKRQNLNQQDKTQSSMFQSGIAQFNLIPVFRKKHNL